MTTLTRRLVWHPEYSSKLNIHVIVNKTYRRKLQMAGLFFVSALARFHYDIKEHRAKPAAVSLKLIPGGYVKDQFCTVFGIGHFLLATIIIQQFLLV